MNRNALKILGILSSIVTIAILVVLSTPSLNPLPLPLHHLPEHQRANERICHGHALSLSWVWQASKIIGTAETQLCIEKGEG